MTVSERDTNHKNWASRLKYRYGITPDVWDDMYAQQDGRCAICDAHQSTLSTTLCVDHNHVTGQVRGLLCRGCNRGLGQFETDGTPTLLLKAVNYLKEYDNANHNQEK